MLTNLNIYRLQILYLFLVGYVIGAFQVPVFELVHFACHLVSNQEINFQVHAYASHNNLHNHQTLDLISESENLPGSEEIPLIDFDSKKKVEILKMQFDETFTVNNIVESTFSYFPSFLADFSEVPHAPPRFF